LFSVHERFPKKTSVKEAKNMLDPETMMHLVWEDRTLKDSELLGDLGLPQDTTLTVIKIPEDTATKQRAATIRSQISKRDLREIELNKKPVDIIKLIWHALFLVLSAVHGEDVATSMVGVFPFKGKREDLTFCIAKMEVIVSDLRPMKDWSEIRTIAYSIVRELSSMHHSTLQQKLREGGEAVEELKRLIDICNFNASNAAKASSAAARVFEWFDVSVKPFIEL
jgi:hypothetical protein